MADTVVIRGRIQMEHTIRGSIQMENVIKGQLLPVMAVYPEPYSGSTRVIPSTQQQTLETAGLTVVENIIVEPIPSNYGLITWNGSTLTVS